MIDILQKYMSADNFLEFTRDYKNLYAARANKDSWKASMQSRKQIEKEPFLKRLYERLCYSYDYKSFKQAVNNTNLFEYIEKDNNLKLFYQCSTYLGLIIETALNDEVLRAGAITEQSFDLDINYKTDIRVNNINYQIKNITYLNYKDQLDRYREKNVQFIFYKIQKDNIYFISFSGNVSFNTDLVETMNIYNTYDTVTAKELIDILSKRGIDNGNTKIQ